MVILRVTLNFPNLRFDRCTLTFTNANYKTPQTVTVSVIASFGQITGATQQMTAYVCAPDTIFASTQIQQSYNVIPQYSSSPKTCTVWGDPHYEAFNGNHFDFQTEGPFYLIKSDMLEIQQQNQNVPGTPVSIMSVLAIRFMSSAIKFTLSPNQCTLTRLNTVDPTHIGIGGALNNPTQSSFQVTLGDATTISITCGGGIHVVITTAHTYGSKGLCYNDQLSAPSSNMMVGDVQIPASLANANAAINTCTAIPDCLPFTCPGGSAGTPCSPCPAGKKGSGGSCQTCM